MKQTFLILAVLGLITFYSCKNEPKEEVVTVEEADTYVDSVSSHIENSAQDLEKDIEEVDAEVDSLLNSL